MTASPDGPARPGRGAPPEPVDGWQAGVIAWAGLAVLAGLMLVLGHALATLTEMALQGTSEPDVRPVTRWAWTAPLLLLVAIGFGRDRWNAQRGLQTITDPWTGRELQIDRFSSPQEIAQFRSVEQEVARLAEPVDGVGRDTPSEHAAAAWTPMRQPETAFDWGALDRPVPPDEAFSPAQARMVGGLRVAAFATIGACLPVTILGMVIGEWLSGSVDGRAWGAWGFVLIPVAWLLALAHLTVRHRWARTDASRESLATFLRITGFVLATMACLVGFAGVVMRMWWVALASLGVVLLGVVLIISQRGRGLTLVGWGEQ